ncbi:AAA family ATPase [Actinoplanes sp. M2I2]|uniref:ATP-binding protein n=1 Tax=Actinoplanes sp. M2I2 TaxID=1734444 RepID=UPI002020399E|nr:helix-turn-helix transcriptional regulator [Actinoplanes sp. M2I2]
MIGRSDELAFLLRSLGAIGPGGRFVVIEGTAGIGKTTLVAALETAAQEGGCEVLRCTGVDRQRSGFAALHELLHPVLDLAGVLPSRQQEALLTAFGAVADSPADPLLINVAALGLVEEVAARRPVLAVVEDLHWLDPSSAAALDFVARRLSNAAVLMVATVRPGEGPDDSFGGPDARRLSLGTLADDESERLLDEVAPRLTGRSRRRVLLEAAGNPLALHEYAAALGATTEESAPPLRLPTSRRLEQAFVGDLAVLPGPSRALLLLAAAGDESTHLPDLLAAGAEEGITPSDVLPLEHNRLVTVRGNRLEFMHPLVRSAVYGAASTVERAAAHRRLASVENDAVRAVWHRASALLERDEPVAAELEAVARIAQGRGALPDAVAALRRAAELSPDPGDRIHRLALAAELVRRAGQIKEASAILGDLIPVVRRPADVTLVIITETRLGLTAGHPMRSLDELIAIVERLEASTPAETVALRTLSLAAAAGRAWGMGVEAAVATRLRAAAAKLSASHDGWAQQAVLTMVDPVAQAPRVRPMLPSLYTRVLDEAMIDGRERAPGTNQWLHILARVAEAVHDYATARASWEEYRRYHHSSGTIADEAPALHGRSMLRLLAGDLAGALADSERVMELGVLSNSRRSSASGASMSALVHAFRGDFEQATARIRDSGDLRDHQPHAIISCRAGWAAGLVAMAEGRYGDAWLELRQVSVHPTTAIWVVADLAEVGLRSGHEAAVREVVADAERQARAFDAPYIWAVVHRAQAVLAPEDGAGELYELALREARSAGEALEIARCELAFGAWLRRRRRIVQAREHLEQAHRIFDDCGAKALADRASAELRAAGVAAPAPVAGRDEPGPDVTAILTPQELAVAQLAASGLTNKEIADQVYLSPRTVAAHLYRAFPKLGVSGRAQLSDVLRR